jgi:hypothetical protein
VLPDGLTRREAEILAMMGVTQGCKGGHRVLPASFISTLMSAGARRCLRSVPGPGQCP